MGKRNKKHGGGPVKSGRRGGAGKKKGKSGVDDDVAQFASLSGPTKNFKRLQLMRDQRDEAILQRKSRSHGNRRMNAKHLRTLNEMVDVNQGDFSNANDMALNSMMLGARRPGRRARGDKDNHMYNEIQYTSLHRDEVMKRDSRKMPIEFVKAKEVYDPSKSLLDKLVKDRKDFSVEEIIIDDEEGEYDEEEEEDIEQEEVEVSGANDDDDDDDDEEVIIPDTLAFSSEDESEDEINQPTIMFSKINVKSKAKQQMMFIDDNNDEEFELSIDDETSSSDENMGEQEEEIAEYEEPKFFVPEFDEEEDISETEIQVGKYLGHMKTDQMGNKYIDLPLTKKHNKLFAPPSREQIIYDFDEENDERTIEEVQAHVHTKLSGEKKKNDRVSKLSPDLEFGFSEEDYVSFDITSIKIENIRASGDPNNVQYYIQAPVLLGFDEFQWLSKSDINDFLVENGLPESRVDPFLAFVTKHLRDPYEKNSEGELDCYYYDEEAELMSSSDDGDGDRNEDVDADHYDNNEEFISLKSTSHIKSKRKSQRTKVSNQPQTQLSDIYDDGDEESSELDDDLMEGMEELLNMHKNSMTFGRNVDVMDVKTKSIRAKGKRTSKKDTFELEFNINFPMDPQLKSHMQEMYLKRRENKKEKRFEREEARRTDSYLLNKYPYCIEMDEAVQEFKDFYNDPTVEMLRFPPLDFNAHMVLKMISESFHYPCKKIGKGKKEFLQIRKPVSRAKREPDWNQIDKLRKRRKLCFRMDIHLSKEEKILFTRVKNGQTDPWDSKGNKRKGKGNFSYKEGEIVGGNANAISNDSIGRKLLEKMGWQNGDALGVEGNKGIIEPIQVVVKTSKRGI